MAKSTRRRLKFEDFRHETTPDGHCRITVRLEWYGREHETECQDLETHQGRLKAAAAATLGSALSAARKRMDGELVGVKAVRAFDGWVVVVRLSAETEGKRLQLLGSASCEREDELIRCAVLAVLDATNRVLERGLGGD